MNQMQQTLVEAFKRAAAAAVAADPGEAMDGGTCNFDTPTIRVPGVSEATVRKSAEDAGITATAFRWLGGRKHFWVNVPMHGQGNRRTTMMEAALKVLREYPELNAVGYYQMD